MAESLLRRCSPDVFCIISGLQADSGKGKGCDLYAAAVFPGQFLYQCPEFYLAWLSLSQQSALPSVLYLYFPGAVGLLSGVYASGSDSLETDYRGVCRSCSFCTSGTEADNRIAFSFYCVLCGDSIPGSLFGSDLFI